jgi:periplasmic protein TonB
MVEVKTARSAKLLVIVAIVLWAIVELLPAAAEAGVMTARGAGVSTNDEGTQRRIRVGRGIKPPKRIVYVEPVYPPDAKAAGIEGMVVLDAVIDTDGAVIAVEVLTSVPELDQAAIDAVRQWKFEPALLNGEPVEVAMNLTVNFTLR